MSEAQDALMNSVPEPGNILGVTISVEEIQQRIALLAQLQDNNLKTAMGELKLALKANPEACNLLLPEEVGALVAGLYRTTNQKIVVENAKTIVKVSKKIDYTRLDINQLDDF